MKTFESSYDSSYVWVRMIKKVPEISASVFDDFAGHPQGLYVVVGVNFIYIYLNCFFKNLFIIEWVGSFC